MAGHARPYTRPQLLASAPCPPGPSSSGLAQPASGPYPLQPQRPRSCQAARHWHTGGQSLGSGGGSLGPRRPTLGGLGRTPPGRLVWLACWCWRQVSRALLLLCWPAGGQHRAGQAGARPAPEAQEGGAWCPCRPWAGLRLGRRALVAELSRPCRSQAERRLSELAHCRDSRRQLPVGPGSPEVPLEVSARPVGDTAPAWLPRATLALPTAALASPATLPDPCPGAPGLEPTRPPWALGPECRDPLHQPPAGGESDAGAPAGAGTLDSEPLLGALAWALPPGGEPRAGQGEECPVCTEPYGPGQHRLALLNCGHGLCAGCLHRLLDTAPCADLGRARCPLCRQRTPVVEWEICQLQEELLQADRPQRPPAPPPPPPPGPWGSLERRCRLPCPPCLAARLWALPGRGPCAGRLALLGLLLVLAPLLLLVLSPLLLLGRAGR